MPTTPADIMFDAAALLNDQGRGIYTNTNLLAYYNMAVVKLERIFQKNNIPVTNAVSTIITVPADTGRIAFVGTVPQLPANLIDIRDVWQSGVGLNQWTQLDRKTFLPTYLEGTQINQFQYWAWIEQELRLLPANAPNDLKLDYIKSLLPRILISQITEPMEIIGAKEFLYHWTAGLAAQFMGENKTRADDLYLLAEAALEDNLGISVKSQQNIPVRRRPYRGRYKTVGNYA